MRHLVTTTCLAALIAGPAFGQSSNTNFSPAKLAVLRAGDNAGYPWSSLGGAHQSPAFIDEYDPVIPITISNTNTGTNGPIFSVAIPTNDPGALWFNGHAGTEGYLAQSADGGTVAFSGYGGDILASPGTPSQLPLPRGICVIDVNGNSSLPYEGGDWYGLGAGAQTNPRGVVSDDGTNNFFGSGSLDGTEWYNPTEQNPPVTVQELSSSRDVKVIDGTFYCSLQGGDGGGLYPQGIYNLQTFGGGFPVQLPEGDFFELNLVMPASPSYPNVEGFDMNPQRNVAYTADNTYGIQKYVEVDGNWTLACAFAFTNNTGTGGALSFPSSYTGCFGLVVDWSGSYPVVFATTTEGSGGFANGNRLIRLDDNFNYTDGQLHTNVSFTTLATGWSANVAFRGLAWTPDRNPIITSQPANQSVGAGSAATFTVVATSGFPVNYEWLVNGAVDGSQTTASYTVASPSLGDSGSTYQVVVSNAYGAVTSLLAGLTVTSSSTAPSLVSPVPALTVTNAIYDTVTLPGVASGTTPLSYAWYQVTGSGSSLLSDSGDFLGTATATLTINSSTTADSGSYYVVVNNTTGMPSSNLVATVSIINPAPIIFVEPPASAVAASNGVVTFSVSGYPLNAGYQWYQGSTPLTDGGRWSGSQSETLKDGNVQGSDATTYYVVVTSAGGSVTSSIVTLTVETPAPYSALPYTALGAVYQQDFDSLPDPGANVSVNNNTSTFPILIGGTNYSVANPFDFAAPLQVSGETTSTGSPGGGLNLAPMVGWFSSDLGAEQIQATTGDNTTGLIVSFGVTNAGAPYPYTTNNRALGIISSPATSPPPGNAGETSDGLFALRIRNLTGQTLTNLNLSYVSELWRDTAASNIVTNWFYVDQFGTNTTPTNNWTGGLTNLMFWTNAVAGFSKNNNKVYGTNGPLLTTNMAFVNVPLNTAWTPGGILWIVWEETTALSGAQGIGIDNLVFSSGPPTLAIAQAGTNAALTWPQMFNGLYSLQGSTNLANPSGWQTIGTTPSVTNGMNVLNMPVANPTAEFFRLKHN